MSRDIQELFRLIRLGHENAFGELHSRHVRAHNHPNPDRGVFTQLYNKFNRPDDERSDIYSKILVVLWENIVDDEKFFKEKTGLAGMQNFTELKSWLSTVCYKLCLKSCGDNSKIVLSGEIPEPPIGYLKSLNISIHYRYEDSINEIMQLNSPRCRKIWELALRGKSNGDIYEILTNRGMEFRTEDNVRATRSKCKGDLRDKVKKDPRYDRWKECYHDLFD